MRDNISMVGMIVFAGGIVFIWVHPLGIKVVTTGICALAWLICLSIFMDL